MDDRWNDDDNPEKLLEQAEDVLDQEERRVLEDNLKGGSERVAVLEDAQKKLLKVLDIARALNRVGRVEDLLGRILDHALQISEADHAYLLKTDQQDRLQIVASRSREGTAGDPQALADISRTILEKVLVQGETLYTADALNDPEFKSRRSVRHLSLRSVACVPLRDPTGTTGALYVSSHHAAGMLGDVGVEILEAFAAQAAVALEQAQQRASLVEAAESLEAENRNLKHVLEERTSFERVLGKSPAMRNVFLVLERVLENTVTVLLQGETGTGKELVAQAIHFNGSRREANFVPVNCGALPEQLLESELFGYCKGAFTGAERDHMGLVEAASRGTLFLDEIGELTQKLQVKLLRMLQEKEVRRIGENASRKVDVRIIAATNLSLEEEVKAKRFREDLYYRVNVVTVQLPPLRQRGEDVLLLADHFLERVRERSHRPRLNFGKEARRLLMSHDWPGNVRELVNAIERAGALAAVDRIEPHDLLPEYEDRAAVSSPRLGTLKETLLKAEEAAILDAVGESGGNISQAARLLNVSRQHLHTRIRRLELRDKIKRG